jgi:guanylate kinase
VINKKQNTGLIFVISGPSGSGKTTLAQLILKDKKFKNKIVKTVSFTTRPKRSGEREGRDYFFISKDIFKRKFLEKEILEQTRYLGYDYGTPRKELERYLRQQKSIILCLDLRGARRIKRLYPEITKTIFVLPPSVNTLQERISKRCHRIQAEEVRGRLKLAARELKNHTSYDYSIVNKQLKVAVARLANILKQEIAKAR